MMFSSAPQYLKRLGSQFIRSKDSNDAVTLGFAIIPILAIVGVSVDYGRAASARSAMQSAADAAALMVAKDINAAANTDVNKKANAYFKALLNRPDLTGVSVNAVYTTTASAGQSLKLDASASLPNSFMSMPVLGSKQNTDLGTSSTVKWGNARYRVALALDNTGSMAASGKMDELKKAANQMIEDFYAMAKTDADVYISIVPFAETVKISTTFKNATWLRWSGGPDKDSWEDTNGTCKNLPWPYSLFPSSYGTRVKCESVGATWQASSNGKNVWTGCVMDRDKDYDVSNAVPTVTTQGTMVWPTNDSACPSEILGMTPVRSQKQVLLNKIAAMSPSGATNQVIGTAWAWMTHTINAGPYPAPAKDANYDYKDVIILLTDGENTKNRWDGNGSSQSTAVDARQTLLCNNIRAAKFSVFAVQVSTEGSPVFPATKACATNPDDPTYYSYVTQASQMSVKFKSIFEALARLRVSS